MNLLPLLAAGLAASFIAAVASRAIGYNRWHHFTGWMAWLMLLLAMAGLPWLVLFRLVKQDDWVNKVCLYLELARLPVQDRAALQALFEAWREKHGQVRRLPTPRGFAADSAERIDWLSAAQVLARYAESKPYPHTDEPAGVSYLILNPPRDFPNGFYTSGRICLARTGKAEYGVYSEYDVLY
jgi:hypothetical protein